MIFTFSIRDFGHPKLLKSQFGHPVIKFQAMSLATAAAVVVELLVNTDNSAGFGDDTGD